ncbi:MAG TPA: DUF4340 domain-containing protein [Terriglobales bacterium]|jgi:hypothetical protein
MKIYRLILAAIILAALMGAYYRSEHRKSEPEPVSAAAKPPAILTLKEAEISQITLKKRSAEEVVLARDSSGKWQITAPKPMEADQGAVSGMLSTASSLTADRLIEDKTTDWKPYGLAEPELEADITAQGKTQKLLIGDSTPTGNAVYARLDGDPRVFTIASYAKSSFDKGVNDLRDKRLLTVTADNLTRLEISTKKQQIEFGRNKDQWQIVKPTPARADATQVDELVRALTDARMDASESDNAKKNAAAFASATPAGTAKVTDQSGTQELQVRKSKDGYLAKSSMVEGVYKVPSTLGQALDKTPDDFRNKKLFDFGFTDPNKIEIHDGMKAYFLTRSGDDWWSGDSKKMDPAGVQSLVDKLRDLSAAKFVDTGFTSPALDLTVTSNDNKRVEKVQISRTGDRYIARRESEPALYELDARGVDELRKTAEEMKPVGTAKQ